MKFRPFAAIVVCLVMIVSSWVVSRWADPEGNTQKVDGPGANKDISLNDESSHHSSSPPLNLASYSMESIHDFEEWVQGFVESEPGDRDTLIEMGVSIAKSRRAEMKVLIREAPEYALGLALPYNLRRPLPDVVIAELETPISTHASYELLVYCLDPDQEEERTERIATWGKDVFEVFTFGDRLNVSTKNHLSLHGIAIDEVIAMDDNPVRLLTETEAIDLDIAFENVALVGDQYYSFKSEDDLQRLSEIVQADERALGPFPTSKRLALQDNEVEGLSRVLLNGSSGGADFELPEMESEHTEGPKKMLYIRARFSNQDANYEPNSLATVMERQADCEAYWFENSYGKSSLTTTFTDVITLPNSATYYADLTSGRLNALFNDALPLVKAAGEAKGLDWDEANYDFYTMLTTGGTWGYAGVAGVGGRRSHLNGAGSSNVRTASHEFGHNLGLRHANYWRTDSTSPIGRDSIPGGYVGDAERDERIEYGHKFSVMGAQNGGGDLNEGRGHYTTGEKVFLDWLVADDNDWVSIDQTTPEPIRLYRHDVESEFFASMTSGVPRAIKINQDSGDYSETNKRRYWLSYRRLPTNGIAEDWLRHGLEIDWQRENYGGDGSIQLDMTPFSRDDTNTNPNARRDNNDKEDGALIIGRTHSDEIGDIHFTPIAQGGENPNEWIDVLVHLGTQENNQEPVIEAFSASVLEVGLGEQVDFSVNAEDPDGETVYYAWTFGDNAMVVESLNSATASKSWDSNGYYPVRVTVSDGKGGTDTKEIIIRVGTVPDSFSISGRVIHAGLPVENARVNIGGNVQAWTDGRGRYTLPGVRWTSNLVSAAKAGLSFEAQFTNPVILSPFDANGRDWIALENGKGTGSLQLAITPYESTMPLGAILALKVFAWNESGESVTTNPTWSVSGGGTIDQDGKYTPEQFGGPHTITAIQGTSEAEAFVSIEDVKGVGIVSLTPQLSEASGESGIFQIRRYGSTEGVLRVYYSWGRSATNLEDYNGLVDFADIPDGMTSVDVMVELIDDAIAESSEEISVTLKSDTAYTVYSAEAVATIEILDEGDQAPLIEITSPTRSVAMVPEGVGLLISANVTDDGFPDPPGETTVAWSVVDSPVGGAVDFSSAGNNESVAKFSKSGFYRIRIEASDGINSSSVDLGVHAGLVAGTNPSSEAEVVYLPISLGAGLVLEDARGGDNNGTFEGGVSWENAEAGVSDVAIYLDGVDSQINIENANEINLIDHRARSISLWFKAEDPLKSGKQVIYEEGGGIRGLNFYLENGLLYVGGWNSGGSGWEETYFSTELTDTEWHQVGLVLDALESNDAQPEAFRVFLDGVEFARGTAAPLDAHSGNIALGANRGNTRYHDGNSSGTEDRFAGYLDEFHLWNRVLSNSEMGQLFGVVYSGPQVSLASIKSFNRAVVIPEATGLLISVNQTDDDVQNDWTVLFPGQEDSVEFVDGGQGRSLVSFSEPGFYGLRLSADDGRQKSAIDLNIHAGISEPGLSLSEQTLYYSLDETSGTFIQNGNEGFDPGELFNGASLSDTGDGISGAALIFDGDNDYLQIPTSGGMGTDPVKRSLSFWLNPSENASGEEEMIFFQRSTLSGWSLSINESLLSLAAWNNREPSWGAILQVSLQRDMWNHVVVVLDGEQNQIVEEGIRFYLNGVLCEFSEAGKLDNVNEIAWFGAIAEDGPVEQAYAGMIDEVHLFDGYALSIEEVGRLYALGNIGPLVDAGEDIQGISELEISLNGSATDDGRWESPLKYEWLFAGRPGAGSFNPGDSLTTQLELNAGGSYPVALAAFDGQVTTFDTVTVSVDQPTYFDLYMDSYPNLEGAERDYLSDPDLDVWTNVEEYGFGGSPDSSDTSFQLHIRSELVREAGQLFFEFRFPRRQDAGLRGLRYDLEFSEDLSANSWMEESYSEMSIFPIDQNYEEVRVRLEQAMTPSTTPLFGRVRVLLNE